MVVVYVQLVRCKVLGEECTEWIIKEGQREDCRNQGKRKYDLGWAAEMEGNGKRALKTHQMELRSQKKPSPNNSYLSLKEAWQFESWNEKHCNEVLCFHSHLLSLQLYSVTVDEWPQLLEDRLQQFQGWRTSCSRFGTTPGRWCLKHASTKTNNENLLK